MEEAVGKSLDWLKAQQNADGSWGVRNKGAMTGFALQCFAGRCEGLQSAKFGEAVTKGTLFLIELAKKNPHGLLTEDVAGTPGAYEHAIAATALGEMFVLATAESAVPPGLEETFVKAMKVIVDMQGKMGSWDYYSKQLAAGEPPSTREDLSVANWHFQALAVARDTRLKIPGLEACIARAVDYIDDKRTKDGGFGKTVREAHYNQWFLSGGAIAGLQGLAPSGSKTKVSRGIEFLRDYLSAEPMQWDKTCNLYAWVNNTTAFYLAGGSDWDFYVKQWLPEILGAQSPDGSFRKGRPDWPAADAADPVYRQTLCTLQLQVFYRHAN